MFRRSNAMRLFKNSALTYINVKRFASAADLEYVCVLGGQPIKSKRENYGVCPTRIMEQSPLTARLQS